MSTLPEGSGDEVGRLEAELARAGKKILMLLAPSQEKAKAKSGGNPEVTLYGKH